MNGTPKQRVYQLTLQQEFGGGAGVRGRGGRSAGGNVCDWTSKETPHGDWRE